MPNSWLAFSTTPDPASVVWSIKPNIVLALHDCTHLWKKFVRFSSSALMITEHQLSKHALMERFHGWQLCWKMSKTVCSDGTPPKRPELKCKLGFVLDRFGFICMQHFGLLHYCVKWRCGCGKRRRDFAWVWLAAVTHTDTFLHIQLSLAIALAIPSDIPSDARFPSNKAKPPKMWPWRGRCAHEGEDVPMKGTTARNSKKWRGVRGC